MTFFVGVDSVRRPDPESGREMGGALRELLELARLDPALVGRLELRQDNDT